MKRLKTLFFVLFIIILYGTSSIICFAENSKIDDMANLFSYEQEQDLSNKSASIAKSTSINIVIVTTNFAQGKSAMEFADDYYDNLNDNYDYTDDGVLFLIDMDNREIWLSTSGQAITLLTDNRIDNILDSAYVFLGSEDYYSSADVFLTQTEYWISLGYDDNTEKHTYWDYDSDDYYNGHYNSPNYGGRQMTAGTKALISIIVALIVGAISCIIVKSKYKSFGSESSYRLKTALNLTDSQDIVTGKNVIHRRIHTPRPPNSSGGGSSVHRSSGGHSHGGGGRKF